MGHGEQACNHGWFECNSRKVVMSKASQAPFRAAIFVAEGMGGRRFLLDRQQDEGPTHHLTPQSDEFWEELERLGLWEHVRLLEQV